MNKLKILDKGITLISLSITVIILLLITGVLVYNAKDSIEIRNYRNLSNDIQNLRDKVSEFYNEYGNIPAKIKYTNLSENIKNVFNNQELENIDKFYVIDLQVMEGISLNYGKDYEKVKNNEAEANNYQDLYIINKITHGIFYVQGVKVKDNGITNIYYTDYLEPNNEEVDYRYVDGVKIPEGFYYVGGSKEEGLVISDVKNDDLENSKGGNQFVWIPVEDGDFKADDETFATDEEEFVKSVNKNKGFYIGRFEAGIEGATGLDYSELDEEYWAQTEEWTGWKGGTLVSKKDVLPWNYITVKKAMKLTEKMYTENSENVKTRIYSKNAYDAVLEFLGKEEDTDYKDWGNCLESEFTIDSPNAKKFNGTANLEPASGTKLSTQTMLLTTGSSEQHKIKNVYDLAGSVMEYTTQVHTISSEDGEIYFNYYGTSFGATSTHISTYNSTRTANEDMGFRVVLYIKDLVDIQNERITLDTNGQIPANTQIDGTQCYINFDMKTEEGYTAKVEPSLPFGITKNGEYSFKITVTKPDGTESVVVHTVNVQNYVEEPNYWLRFNGGSHIEFDNIDQNDFFKSSTIAIKLKINYAEQTSKRYMGLWGNHRNENGIALQFTEQTSILRGADMTPYYDKWVDIVQTNDGTTTKIYINGELKSTQEDSKLPYEGFNIGTSYLPEDRQLIGEMSCLKIWDKALTEEEVRQIDLFKQEVNVAKDDVYFNLNLTSKEDVEAQGGRFVGNGDYQFYNKNSSNIIEYRNEKITKDAEGNIPANTQIVGTECYLNFETNVQQGYTVQVTPSLPYKITQNGTYTFNVNVTDSEGKQNSFTHSVYVGNYVSEPDYWLRFNGGSHIEFANIDQNDFYNHFTIATKVKINRAEQASKQYMGLWGNHANSEGVAVQFNKDTTTLDGVSDMTNYYDKWIDVIITYDGTTKNAYVNGELRLTYSDTTLPYEGFNIGTSYLPSDRQLIGEMTCLKIWDKALSQEEIWQIDLFKQEVNVAKDNLYFNLNLTSKQDVEAMGGTFVGTGDYQFYNN